MNNKKTKMMMEIKRDYEGTQTAWMVASLLNDNVRANELREILVGLHEQMQRLQATKIKSEVL